MKRLIISLAFFGAIAAISFCGIHFVNNTFDSLTDLLNKAEQAAQEQDFEKAEELCDEVEKVYVKRERFLSAFVNRGVLDEIGLTISSLSPLAKEESKAEFFSNVKEAKTSLKHIKNDQALSPENLF